MPKRKSHVLERTTPSTSDPIPPTTIKLGWGDKRAKTNTQGAGFYVYYGERFMFQSFDTDCTAKHFLEFIIDGDDYKWEVWPDYRIGDINGITKEALLVTARGVQIRGAGLENAMEYEYGSEAEREFVFPEPYHRMYSTWVARGPIDTEPKAPARVDPVYDHETGELVKAPKAERPARAPKEPKAPRPSKEGLVLVSDIAAELKVDPKHVRAALRRAKVDKPAVGWAFPSSDVPLITALIKENLK